ncbi:MAG TPA: MFS transporter, partial [Actinomycetota bacterium]|nr:MFS transporter [Actinomycetota bacterium]
MADTTRIHHISFWTLTALLGFFLFAASAPSSLYRLYAAKWDFSALTLTAIYAVYAAGALAALLVTGRLSDHLGRRRVVLVSIAVQLLALASFGVADNVAYLFVGRTLQGAATGIASGAISAWLVD